MSKLLRMLLLAAAVAIGSAAPGGAAQQLRVPGAYTHAPSGMTFPTSVAGFRRGTVYQYDVEGLDVSANYQLRTGSGAILATVYVYPPAAEMRAELSWPEVCATEYELRKEEIARAHPGLRLLGEDTAERAQGGSTFRGRRARFEFSAEVDGRRETLSSHLYLFCDVGGGWIVKYRFTQPKSLNAENKIAAFMRALPWKLPAMP